MAIEQTINVTSAMITNSGSNDVLDLNAVLQTTGYSVQDLKDGNITLDFSALDLTGDSDTITDLEINLQGSGLDLDQLNIIGDNGADIDINVDDSDDLFIVRGSEIELTTGSSITSTFTVNDSNSSGETLVSNDVIVNLGALTDGAANDFTFINDLDTTSSDAVKALDNTTHIIGSQTGLSSITDYTDVNVNIGVDGAMKGAGSSGERSETVDWQVDYQGNYSADVAEMDSLFAGIKFNANYTQGNDADSVNGENLYTVSQTGYVKVLSNSNLGDTYTESYNHQLSGYVQSVFDSYQAQGLYSSGGSVDFNIGGTNYSYSDGGSFDTIAAALESHFILGGSSSDVTFTIHLNNGGMGVSNSVSNQEGTVSGNINLINGDDYGLAFNSSPTAVGNCQCQCDCNCNCNCNCNCDPAAFVTFTNASGMSFDTSTKTYLEAKNESTIHSLYSRNNITVGLDQTVTDTSNVKNPVYDTGVQVFDEMQDGIISSVQLDVSTEGEQTVRENAIASGTFEDNATYEMSNDSNKNVFNTGIATSITENDTSTQNTSRFHEYFEENDQDINNVSNWYDQSIDGKQLLQYVVDEDIKLPTAVIGSLVSQHASANSENQDLIEQILTNQINNESNSSAIFQTIMTADTSLITSIYSSLVDSKQTEMVQNLISLANEQTVANLLENSSNTDLVSDLKTQLIDCANPELQAGVLKNLSSDSLRIEIVNGLQSNGNLNAALLQLTNTDAASVLKSVCTDSDASISVVSGLQLNSQLTGTLSEMTTADIKTALNAISTDLSATISMINGLDSNNQLGTVLATMSTDENVALINRVSDSATRVTILDNIASAASGPIILGLNGETLGSILTDPSCSPTLMDSICTTLKATANQPVGLTLIADIINDDGSLSDDLFGSLLSGLSSEEIGSVMSQLFPSRIASGQAFMDYIQANKSAESIGEILAYCGDNQEALIDWALSTFTVNKDIAALYTGFASESDDMTLLDSKILGMDTSDIVEILGYMGAENATTFIETNAQTLWDNHMAGMLTDADSSVLLILCLTDDTARETISPIILESLSDTARRDDFATFVSANQTNQVILDFLLSNLDNDSMNAVVVDILKVELEAGTTDEGSMFYLLTKDFYSTNAGLYPSVTYSLNDEIRTIFCDLIEDFGANADDGAVTAPTDYDSALDLLYEWNLNDHGLGGETRQMIYDLISALINSDLAYPRPD